MYRCQKCADKYAFLYNPKFIAVGAFLTRDRDEYDAMSYVVRFDSYTRKMVRCCYRHTGRPPISSEGE